MARIDSNNAGTTTAGKNFDPTQAFAAMQGRVGNLRGEQVLVVLTKDAASVLADAAEEISMLHSEKIEKKNFADRKFRIDSPMDLMGSREIQAYLRSAGLLDDKARMQDLARRMQAQRSDPRELARQLSRDPAHQYVLLQFALDDAITNKAPREVIERLQDALADLEMESGPLIRASLNTMGTAADVASTPQGRAVFQDTYRDIVLGHNTLSQTLLLVLERLGGANGGDFQAGLQGLIKALGADLSATRPSTEPSRLQALVQDLYHLEVASTVLEGCGALAARMAERHGIRTLVPLEMMKELVGFTGERWVSMMRFVDLATRFRLQEIPELIAFYAATRELLRQMPVKVFTDLDTRQAVLDGAQSALDQAIKEEEELGESQGESSADASGPAAVSSREHH